MRNRRGTLRVLLDTAFILPTLGIDVGEEVVKGLKKLEGAEIYYSKFSVLESLWVATRVMKGRSFDVERFSQGLRSVIESGRYEMVEEGYRVFKDALKLYALGHKDMIDNILYVASVNLDLKFLTIDSELMKFVRDKGLKEIFVTPSQL